MRGDRLNDGLSAVAVGEGPPLAVVPGLGEGADLSERVPRSVALSATMLARGFRRRVHQVNRPVDPPPGMTITRLAGWYATALRNRFDGPVDVMGMSGGGITALQLTLDHPDVVRRLVLCVAASRVGDSGARELARMMRLERAGRSAAWAGSALMADGPLRLVLAGGLWLTRNRPRAPGEVALVEAVQSWDVTARLGEISVPVLVVGGGRDRIVPPKLVRATAEGIGGARLLMFPRRGHLTALYDRGLKPAVEGFLGDRV